MSKPASNKISDAQKLQNQVRNEMQKSYFLAEVARMRCKDAADGQATNAGLREECQRIRQISESLCSKKSVRKEPNSSK